MSKPIANTATKLSYFFNKIKFTETCWIWTACLDGKGYGCFTIEGTGRGKTQRAHRLSYEIFNWTKLSSKQFLCHSCDNRKCVNPDHLWIGDNAMNMADKIKKGRLFKGSQLTQAKLKESDILKIREMRKQGKLHREIAEVFGVKRENIGAILLGKTWRHV